MQTFLPYADFNRSAKALDSKRLGKQRVECRQILNALTGQSRGWQNHPATLMWKGYEDALKLYYNAVLTEWVKRGYKNNMPFLDVNGGTKTPNWLGNESFHASHRSNLLRKDPVWYSQWKWKEPNNLEYVWPVRK